MPIHRIDASAGPTVVHEAVKAALKADATAGGGVEDDGWGDEDETSNDDWEVVGRRISNLTIVNICVCHQSDWIWRSMNRQRRPRST